MCFSKLKKLDDSSIIQTNMSVQDVFRYFFDFLLLTSIKQLLCAKGLWASFRLVSYAERVKSI